MAPLNGSSLPYTRPIFASCVLEQKSKKHTSSSSTDLYTGASPDGDGVEAERWPLLGGDGGRKEMGRGRLEVLVDNAWRTHVGRRGGEGCYDTYRSVLYRDPRASPWPLRVTGCTAYSMVDGGVARLPRPGETLRIWLLGSRASGGAARGSSNRQRHHHAHSLLILRAACSAAAARWCSRVSVPQSRFRQRDGVVASKLREELGVVDRAAVADANLARLLLVVRPPDELLDHLKRQDTAADGGGVSVCRALGT